MCQTLCASDIQNKGWYQFSHSMLQDIFILYKILSSDFSMIWFFEKEFSKYQSGGS